MTTRNFVLRNPLILVFMGKLLLPQGRQKFFLIHSQGSFGFFEITAYHSVRKNNPNEEVNIQKVVFLEKEQICVSEKGLNACQSRQRRTKR